MADSEDPPQGPRPGWLTTRELCDWVNYQWGEQASLRTVQRILAAPVPRRRERRLVRMDAAFRLLVGEAPRVARRATLPRELRQVTQRLEYVYPAREAREHLRAHLKRRNAVPWLDEASALVAQRLAAGVGTDGPGGEVDQDVLARILAGRVARAQNRWERSLTPPEIAERLRQLADRVLTTPSSRDTVPYAPPRDRW